MTRAFLQDIGETYRDFKVLTCTQIEELDCYFRELVHEPTGAHVIHIENEDPENLFCLSFRTLPQNNRGTPHILEHVTLCGSEKFPIKDPFFSMGRRSLNTFMNALTGSDFTCYPAASQVEKDFYNLLDVYLDAVFHPQIKKMSFLQEGCRLEFKDPEDSSSPLEFKGIVYNEMKGSITPDSKLWHDSLSALFPDLPYAYNAGGEPKDIPNLSYEELLDFHKTHYHPSRCLFFFYGSFSLKNHLDYILENALTNIKPKAPLPPLPKQPRFLAPKKQKVTYALSEDQKHNAKTFVSFAWLTCHITEQTEVLALTLLDAVLMDSDASPLKKPLLESGLCAQVDALMDTELSEVPYILTLKGCKESEVDDLEAFLFQTLKTLSEKPFPEHVIEAAIHQIEFSRMEITGDHGPFGLSLFFRTALAKQQGGDPLYMLKIHSLFKDLLKNLKDPFYLPNLLKKHLIDNPHRIQITMTPDFELEKKEIEEEENHLKNIAKSLSKEQKNIILEQTKELDEMQKNIEDQDLRCLPKVTLDDVPLLPKDFPLKQHLENPSFKIFHHACFTNSILYADLVFDLPAVEQEEIPYLRLLLSILPSLGAGGRNYVENLEHMMSYTGGVSTSTSLYVQGTDRKKKNPALLIRGKSLARNKEKLFSLMCDTLQTPDLTDKKRLKELIEQIHSSLQNRVSKNAMRYAIQLSLSGYDDATFFGYHSSGLPYYHFIEKIEQGLPGSLDSLVQKLTELHKKLFSFHNLHLVLSCDQQLYESISKEDLYSLSKLTPSPFIPWTKGYSFSEVPSQGRIITSQVAYNVQAFSVAPYIHPHAPAIAVASQLFEHTSLHNKIREIGGAYGSGATYNSLTGSFYFYSYRDPHITSTFEAFEESTRLVGQGKFGTRDLEEAKLSMIQQMDMPVSPGSQAILGYNLYRDNKSKALREEYRRNLLNLTASDIEKAVQLEFLSDHKKGVNITFAGKDQFEKQKVSFEVFPL
jgi:presequence protease